VILARYLVHEQALLSVFCALTTFFIGTSLAGVRKGKLFTKKIREVISDFGPTIGTLISI
jgi:hypothetical protein